MTPEQKKLARHALGLPNNNKRSYRNRFLANNTTPACQVWMEMEQNGEAESSPDVSVKNPDAPPARTWFFLTRRGAEAALNRGESLCPEDFPPQEAGLAMNPRR